MCLDTGISPRRLEGWEPAQYVKIDYDGEGRRVSETITRDPEWDAEDRALIAGLLHYEANLCHNCGQYRDEVMWRIPSQSDEAIIEYFLTHPKAMWHAAFYTCRGCVAKEKAQRNQDRIDEAAAKSAKSSGKRLDLYPAARHWFSISRAELAIPVLDDDG